MPMDQSDEDIARLLRDLHLPPEALHELAEVLSLTDALTEAGASPSITNDVLSTFIASHFTVRGSNNVGEATQGIRPGHLYADAVFAFAFQRVFKNVAKRLDDLDLRLDILRGPQHMFQKASPNFQSLPSLLTSQSPSSPTFPTNSFQRLEKP